MKLFKMILPIFLILSISCTTSSEPETTEFLNTEWQLKTFETPEDGIIQLSLDQDHIVQFLDNDSIEGKNDCNTLYGTYEVQTDNQLFIHELGGTKINCGSNYMGDEFLEAMSASKSYEIDKDKLIIYYGSNLKLSFKAK